MSNIRSLIPRLTAGLFLLTIIDAGVLAAQAAPRLTTPTTIGTGGIALPATQSSQPSAATVPAGPRTTQAAFHAPALAKELPLAPFKDAHIGAGRNVALMGVGFAGLLTGLIIGGSAGTVIAIGGGLIGLYGLFHFLQ